MRRYCVLSLTGFFLLATLSTLRAEKPARQRRILCNYDGSSTLYTRKGSQGPVSITVDDLKAAVREVADEGSQVDTILLCVNAQVMYYPTKVGTMLGDFASAEDRKKWPVRHKQWYKNLKHFHDKEIDPWAVMLAEAKKQKLEGLLSFRMNDGHGNSILHTKFWADHPEYHCFHPDQGHTLDYGHKEVRDHMFLLIEEAVQRYDCDGIELDFNRFPTLFNEKTPQPQRIAKMNSFVERIRKMLDREGKKRHCRLVLGVRPPTSDYEIAATYAGSLKVGCDPVAWAKNGWIDFLTVSRFLHVTFDLPVASWKKLITDIPVYGCIEIVDGKGAALTPKQYRRAARHIWDEGADGIYLFNFFITREGSTEPAFEVLNQLGDRGVTE